MSDRTGDRPDAPGDEDREAAESAEAAEAAEAASAGDTEPAEAGTTEDDGTREDPADGNDGEAREVTSTDDVDAIDEAVAGEDADEPTGEPEQAEQADSGPEPDDPAEERGTTDDAPEETGSVPTEAAEAAPPVASTDAPARDPEPLVSPAEENDADDTGDTERADAADDAARTVGGAGDPPSGWRRLGSALHPRATRSQVLAGVLCAALGFALVVQVQQSASDQLSSARQEDLVRLLDEVTDRAQQLGDEVSGLEATRDELRSGTGKAQSALELAQQRAESEGILSGRLPAQGPGVDVTIQDPGGQLRASQMFNVLEELRNAGAEVVELNDVRLVTSTWFEDKGDAIVVDGTRLTSPYEWTVIGDPETLDRALEIPGGALATVRTAGAEATTTRQDQVTITAVTPPQEPEYAQPEREQG